MPPENEPAAAVPGATYPALGAYIGAQSPYGSNTTLPSFQGDVTGQTDATAAKQIDVQEYHDNHVVKHYGISAANNAGNVVTFMPEQQLLASLTAAENLKVMRWTLRDDQLDANGQPREEEHLVTKAIRVWYTYRAPDPNNPGQDMDVGTFLLVGFVGHGQP